MLDQSKNLLMKLDGFYINFKMVKYQMQVLENIIFYNKLRLPYGDKLETIAQDNKMDVSLFRNIFDLETGRNVFFKYISTVCPEIEYDNIYKKKDTLKYNSELDGYLIDLNEIPKGMTHILIKYVYE